jgi:hypothetical protein
MYVCQALFAGSPAAGAAAKHSPVKTAAKNLIISAGLNILSLRRSPVRLPAGSEAP